MKNISCLWARKKKGGGAEAFSLSLNKSIILNECDKPFDSCDHIHKI